jgi:hypothetical protein
MLPEMHSTAAGSSDSREHSRADAVQRSDQHNLKQAPPINALAATAQCKQCASM